MERCLVGLAVRLCRIAEEVVDWVVGDAVAPLAVADEVDVTGAVATELIEATEPRLRRVWPARDRVGDIEAYADSSSFSYVGDTAGAAVTVPPWIVFSRAKRERGAGWPGICCESGLEAME